MPDAVVNSTPIISLHCINRLDLLSKMYHNVYVPYGVYEEVCVDGDIGKETLFSFPNISIQKITNENARRYFKTTLNKGEVETMILADELKSDVCIIDDKLAREYAKHLGIKITGTLGVLIKAKKRGFIEKVTPYLDLMIENNIFIGKSLYENVKRLSEE